MVGRFKSVLGSLVAAAACCLSSTSALAVSQPNGTVVPVLDASVTTCVDKNVEVCLDLAEGDPASIDSRADALIAPETFQPTCQLTFTPIVKGGIIFDVFGWYNVRANAAGAPVRPLPAELFGMYVTSGFKTGAELAGTSIVLDLGVEAAAGRYKGGQIGFFLVSSGGEVKIEPTTHRLLQGNGMPLQTPEYEFYTQHALNKASMGAMPYYNVLTWESTTKKNTFYFGWEDLPTTSGSDNDFDDFVFAVSGVQCGGGGQPCETGQLGVCAAGTLQCKKGVIQCLQNIPSSAEICNALDDDCNGSVDDGDALCGAKEVCDRGVCVQNCGTGEFRCPGDLQCTTGGFCVDAACKDITCEEGKVCHGGECVDSCTGIVCPHDRACRNGGCVDPCVGIECDEGFSCVLGVCTSCDCAACGAGLVCHDSLCVDTGCETQTCGAMQHCSLGACVDNCDGASCPLGQLCSGGECVADPTYSGSTGGTDGTGGLILMNPNGGNPGTGGLGSTNGGKTSVDALDVSKPACGCEVPGRDAGNKAALVALALLGLTLARRNRRAAA